MQNPVRVEAPQRIYEALREVRQTALTSAAPGVPPVRTTVLNLVVHAPDRMQAAEMAAQVAALAEQHPTRTILLIVDPLGLAGDWDINVAAHCHPDIPGYLVCFEGVELVAHGPAVAQLPAVALSLLVPDLPVVLWWPGDVALGTQLFERLMSNCDRLLVDTASAGDPEELLRRLAGLGGTERCQCAISDFNWYRLTPWRDLTAQFFDAPECRICLETMEWVRLEVAQAAGRADWTPGYLLAGWLASRLGWAPAGPLWSAGREGEQADLLHGQRRVTIEFVAAAGAAVAASLQSVTMRASHPGGEAIFSIRRTPHAPRAELSIQLPGSPARARVVPFAAAAPTELLSAALEEMGRDPAYEDALRMAALFSARQVIRDT